MKRLTICLLAALCATPVFAQTPAAPKVPTLIALGFKADIGTDGVPANVTPDASLPPALQEMVRKRVTEWRYLPAIWQGKPLARPVSQQITAEVLQVAGGGFAMRIREVGGAPPPMTADGKPGGTMMVPPHYPLESRKRGVDGTLVYAVRVDGKGASGEITLLSPEKLERRMRPLDEAARTAIQQWAFSAIEVDGVAIECQAIIPMQFALDRPKPDMPDLAPFRARVQDACPGSPALLTPVADTLL